MDVILADAQSMRNHPSNAACSDYGWPIFRC